MGQAFDAAVPGEVFVHAVAVVFAVGVVVLVVVGDEIPQREAVVAGDKVERVIGHSPRMFVKVGAAADASSESASHAEIAAPEAADVVAESAIPFGPAAAE